MASEEAKWPNKKFFIEQKALKLLEEAEAYGLEVSIDYRPLKPLSMGNKKAHVVVSRKRVDGKYEG